LLEIGGLVVGWVTTSEYPLLYVLLFFFYLRSDMGVGAEDAGWGVILVKMAILRKSLRIDTDIETGGILFLGN
jgi:hypothetical protein